MITLDSNYSIKVDTKSYSLVYQEQRERKKRNKNRKPTNETEEYTFRDYWFFPNIGLCLKKYRTLKHKECEIIADVINVDANINARIKELEKIIFKD